MASLHITLRSFDPRDRFTLNRWLGEQHVADWFGSRGVADAEIALAQASPSALVRIICDGATAIGYLHAFDAVLLGGVRPKAFEDGCFVMTAIIGAAAYRGQGHGAAALAIARGELFTSTLALSVAVQVPLKNERAVRALEKQGFRWREVWHDAALGPCWVLTTSRDGRVTP